MPATIEHFAAPDLELRPLNTDLDLQPAPALDLAGTEILAPTNHLSGKLAPIVRNRLERDFDQDLLERLDRAGYFNPPPPPPDSPVLRWVDATFRPEEVQLGKRANVSCSLYTAFKHKNPLCLLDSMFLHLSW